MMESAMAVPTVHLDPHVAGDKSGNIVLYIASVTTMLNGYKGSMDDFIKHVQNTVCELLESKIENMCFSVNELLGNTKLADDIMKLCQSMEQPEIMKHTGAELVEKLKLYSKSPDLAKLHALHVEELHERKFGKTLDLACDLIGLPVEEFAGYITLAAARKSARERLLLPMSIQSYLLTPDSEKEKAIAGFTKGMKGWGVALPSDFEKALVKLSGATSSAVYSVDL